MKIKEILSEGINLDPQFRDAFCACLDAEAKRARPYGANDLSDCQYSEFEHLAHNSKSSDSSAGELPLWEIMFVDNYHARHYLHLYGEFDSDSFRLAKMYAGSAPAYFPFVKIQVQSKENLIVRSNNKSSMDRAAKIIIAHIVEALVTQYKVVKGIK